MLKQTLRPNALNTCLHTKMFKHCLNMFKHFEMFKQSNCLNISNLFKTKMYVWLGLWPLRGEGGLKNSSIFHHFPYRNRKKTIWTIKKNTEILTDFILKKTNCLKTKIKSFQMAQKSSKSNGIWWGKRPAVSRGFRTWFFCS